MAETSFVSKLKNYTKAIRNNGPKNFSLGMMKAHYVLYERIFLFSLCDDSNKSYREKTEDTLARKPPC